MALQQIYKSSQWLFNCARTECFMKMKKYQTAFQEDSGKLQRFFSYNKKNMFTVTKQY